MTKSPFRGYVSIDTNVFMHLLNCTQNPDRHIHRLLEHLQKEEVILVVDDKGRILKEYEHHLSPIISNQRAGILNELYILRFWIRFVSRLETPVDLSDTLMNAIKKVVKEPSENTDRIFVYVAFLSGNILISNDDTHIVTGPVREHGVGPRRHRLLSSTRKLRPNGADILTSKEAYDKCPSQL